MAIRETVVAEMVTISQEKSIVEQIAERRSALAIKELAQLVNLDYNTIHDLVKNGILPAMRIGSSLRLDPKTTAEWLRQRTST
jgi:excisionase family DNA binding protein